MKSSTFSVHGGLADSQVLLHADAGEEGQDHLCECRWFHLGFLGFDISHNQIFEKSVALRNDFLRRAWEHGELAHGIHREAAFLTFQSIRSFLAKPPVNLFDGGEPVHYDGAIMVAKTQIALETEMQRRARQRANDLGVSLAELFPPSSRT
jgi:hypothetical protein